MFERFTDRSRRVLVLAQEEARHLSCTYIGTEHFLLALLAEQESLAARVLASSGVDLVVARRQVAAAVTPSGSAFGSPPFTFGAKKSLELALRAALRLGDEYIGPEHLLLGVLDANQSPVLDILDAAGVDPLELHAEVQHQAAEQRASVTLRMAAGARERRSLATIGDLFFGPETGGRRPETTPAVRMIATEAQRLAQGDPVGSQHVLLALFHLPGSLAAKILEHLGTTEEAVGRLVTALGVAGTTDEVPEASTPGDPGEGRAGGARETGPPEGPVPTSG